MGGIVVLFVIMGLLWIAAQQSEKHGEQRHRIAFEATKHLPSFLRECTGVGPWLEMDDFYRKHNVDLKCTSCSRDTIFVSNASPTRETEFIDVHFAKGKLRIVYGSRILFDGDPLNLMSYPQETFPLKEDCPPPTESGSYYSIWVDYFKDVSNRKLNDPNRVKRSLPSNPFASASTPDTKIDSNESLDEKRLAELVKTAQQGDDKSQLLLGGHYNNPLGGPFQPDEAAAWYRMAAEQGNTNAQENLGSIFFSGIGIPQSYSEAYFWTYLADSLRSKNGSARGSTGLILRHLVTKLTPIELSQAQARAGEWLLAHNAGPIGLKGMKDADQTPIPTCSIIPTPLETETLLPSSPTKILPGISIECALQQFRLQVNRPDTIFSTEHWLTLKLEKLRTLLSDPITAEQAQGLNGALHGNPMEDLIEWLEAPPMSMYDFFTYRERQKKDALWERWKEQEAEEKLERGYSSQLESCPKCGSQSVVEIIYGSPTPEQQEAARRGAVALGGCMMTNAEFSCQQCEYCWPEGEFDDESEWSL